MISTILLTVFSNLINTVGTKFSTSFCHEVINKDLHSSSNEMKSFVKPRIVISKCIEFDFCRFNSQIIRSEIVSKLKPHVEFLPDMPRGRNRVRSSS